MTKILNKTNAARLQVAGVAVLVLLAAQAAVAAPQLMTDYGDQWAWRAGDVNAMGGTGIALYRGGISNVFNPALLASETGTRLDAGVSLDQESEDRFQPLFDTFDNWVTDVSIAANRNHFWQGGFGAAHRVLDGGVPVTAALSLTDRYPFQYRFEEELRNPDPFAPIGGGRDVILENRARELTGTLRDLALGVGVGVHDRIAVGAAVHYAFGTRTDTWRVRDFDSADGDSSYEQVHKQELDGVNMTLGLQATLSERLDVGLAWESRLKASGDFSTRRTEPDAGLVVDETHEGYYRYPAIYRAGLVFRPRTDPVTVFTVELEYMPWSKTEDSEQEAGANAARLQDTMDVRIGLQHLFYSGIPVRFGFRHYDSYADRDASASAFSGGVGLPFARGLFSFSLELSKIESVRDHQFPYPPDYLGGQFEADPQARVEDTRMRFGVTYAVTF